MNKKLFVASLFLVSAALLFAANPANALNTQTQYPAIYSACNATVKVHIGQEVDTSCKYSTLTSQGYSPYTSERNTTVLLGGIAYTDNGTPSLNFTVCYFEGCFGGFYAVPGQTYQYDTLYNGYTNQSNSSVRLFALQVVNYSSSTDYAAVKLFQYTENSSQYYDSFLPFNVSTNTSSNNTIPAGVTNSLNSITNNVQAVVMPAAIIELAIGVALVVFGYVLYSRSKTGQKTRRAAGIGVMILGAIMLIFGIEEVVLGFLVPAFVSRIV